MTTIEEQAFTALQSLPLERREELAKAIIDAALPSIQYNDLLTSYQSKHFQKHK